MWLDCDDDALNGRLHGAQTWRPAELNEFAAYVAGHDGEVTVLADCTASDIVADHYAGWLRAGIHVVTPNKRAASGPLPRWREIAMASDASGARLHYEGTVGAGLPVVQTLRDLIYPANQLMAVEDVLSAPWRGCSTASTARRPSPPSYAKRTTWVTRNPTRATTCPAWTWPASW